MKGFASLVSLCLVLRKVPAAAAAVVVAEGHGYGANLGLRPRQTDDSVSTDLQDYAPDPNTAFLSVSGTNTAWVPKDTNAISTVTVTTTSNGQVGTTVTAAAVALYTGPSGDLNYLIAPALREHIEDIAQALCGVPDVPVKKAKRDQLFCSYPQSNLDGSFFDSVVQQLLNELISLFYKLGTSIPQSLAGNELTVPKVAFIMVDNAIGSLRDDNRVPLSGKIPVDSASQPNDRCPYTIPRCSECGGGNTGFCTGALYRCPCETSCPLFIDEEPSCKDKACDSKNGKVCSKDPFAGCPCQSNDNCPEFKYAPECIDELCKGTNRVTCSTELYLECPCKDLPPVRIEQTPTLQWLLDRDRITNVLNDDDSCGEGSFRNASTLWQYSINRLVNTGFIILTKSEHPELFEPGTQWRFSDLQGILRQFSVYADDQSTPPSIIEQDETYITFEVAPNTQTLTITTVLKEDIRPCDTEVLVQSDGVASDGCGGALPDLPEIAPPAGCAPLSIPDLPDVTQDPSFRVFAQRSTEGGTWIEGLAMYGVDVNCPDIATRSNAYTMVLSSYTLESGASDPYPLLQNSTGVINYSDFALTGGRGNGIAINKPCGLDTEFYFQKKKNGRFYWSDRGQQTDAWQGYCDVPPQNKPFCIPNSPNGQKEPYSYAVLLNCFEIDNHNYCLTYGSTP